MGAVSDVISSVFIMLLLIIGLMIMTTLMVKQGSIIATLAQEEVTDDVLSTTMDSILLVTEPVSNRRFGLLIGDAMRQRNPVVKEGKKYISLIDALNIILENTFGKGNYYFQIQPRVTGIHLSFLFDGSPSTTNEREELKNRIAEIVEEFKKERIDVTYTIYILNKEDACTIFVEAGIPITNCKIIRELYYVPKSGILQGQDDFREVYGITDPYKSFGFVSEKEPTKPYLESDWGSGIAYVLNDNQQLLKETKHIIFPISDEISTGSKNLSYFTASATSEIAKKAKSLICDRVENHMISDLTVDRVLDLVREQGALVYPINVVSCDFVFPQILFDAISIALDVPPF